MPDRTYCLQGPFEIPRTDDLLQVDRTQLKKFWQAAEEANSGIATASGCYIFSIRARRGAKPWYVGQAKATFKQECFRPHKLLRYNEVINRNQGRPTLFLLARMTPGGKFVKRLGKKEADWVESLLIRQCLSANRDLVNVSGTAFATEVVIPGLLRNPPGNPRSEVSELRNLLNLQ